MVTTPEAIGVSRSWSDLAVLSVRLGLRLSDSCCFLSAPRETLLLAPPRSGPLRPGNAFAMLNLAGHSVYDHLASAGVPLRAAATFGDGLAGALWDRNEDATARYETPSHHTLSLYVSGGLAFRRRLGEAAVPSFGPGSLCLMPRGASSEWEVSGPIRMLHLYISRQAFDRAVVATIDADPDRVHLLDVPYFQDPVIESVMRQVVLPLDWNEPSEQVAISHAAQTLLAYLISRLTERGPRALEARGGLSPAALRRVSEFIAAHLAAPLSVMDLASCAGLSPHHFARAFRRSTGESPHAFVLRCRIERAKEILSGGMAVSDVAALCGFSSQSHFTARFRQMTGVTPGQFVRGI